MTQEEKQLLTNDLCARLPYGVFIHTWYNKPLDIKCTGIDLYTNTINLDIPDDDNAKVYIDNCKLYLRPMSSMTMEEKKVYDEISHHLCGEITAKTMIYFLNAHHLDYNNLIEVGLALGAPEGLYNN